MQVTGKVVVVTGGANGIGEALCEAFHKAGAAKVVVADMDAAKRKSGRCHGGWRGLQMRRRAGKEIVLTSSRRPSGSSARSTLFCSNAGIGGGFDPHVGECRRRFG